LHSAHLSRAYAYPLSLITVHHPERSAQFGFLAEEVEKVDPELVIHDAQGKPYSVRYEQINAIGLDTGRDYRHDQVQLGRARIMAGPVERLASTGIDIAISGVASGAADALQHFAFVHCNR